MATARTLTVTVPAEVAAALGERVRAGEFSSEGEALVAVAKSWQSRRDQIERQREAIRRDIAASLEDPRPSIPIDEVEQYMERYMAEAEASSK